jgi:hypothetical protein
MRCNEADDGAFPLFMHGAARTRTWSPNGRNVRSFPGVLIVAAVTLMAPVTAFAAGAEAPSGALTVVSSTVVDGQASLVVAVPRRLRGPTLTARDISVASADGTPIAADVQPVPSATSAVAVLMLLPTTDVALARERAVVAELARLFEPDVPVALVTTGQPAVLVPTTTSRSALYVALAALQPQGTTPVADAVSGAAAQLADPSAVAPWLVIVDPGGVPGALDATTTAQRLASGRVHLSVAATEGRPSTAVAALARAAGAADDLSRDPVAVMDSAADAVGVRYSVSFPAPAAGTARVRVTTGATQADVAVTLGPPAAPSRPPPIVEGTAISPATTAGPATATASTSTASTSTASTATASTAAAGAPSPGPAASRGTPSSASGADRSSTPNRALLAGSLVVGAMAAIALVAGVVIEVRRGHIGP